jgi:hypothetical protein
MKEPLPCDGRYFYFCPKMVFTQSHLTTNVLKVHKEFTRPAQDYVLSYTHSPCTFPISYFIARNTMDSTAQTTPAKNVFRALRGGGGGKIQLPLILPPLLRRKTPNKKGEISTYKYFVLAVKTFNTKRFNRGWDWNEGRMYWLGQRHNSNWGMGWFPAVTRSPLSKVHYTN